VACWLSVSYRCTFDAMKASDEDEEEVVLRATSVQPLDRGRLC